MNLCYIQYGHNCMGMTFFQCHPFDLESFHVVSQRRVQVVHLIVQISQLVKGRGHIWVKGSQGSSSRLQGTLVHESCLVVVPLLAVDFCHTLVDNGNVSMVRAKLSKGNLAKFFVAFHGAIQLSSLVVCLPLVADGSGDIDGACSEQLLPCLQCLCVRFHCQIVFAVEIVNPSHVVQNSRNLSRFVADRRPEYLFNMLEQHQHILWSVPFVVEEDDRNAIQAGCNMYIVNVPLLSNGESF
mmetsp:Transcript_16955/g.46501  ORF Transcript_16955/g.46501 Transcript_16955/m.46501 type:complete len:240 (-) Transcript_16955:803-1522(-)